MAFGLGRQQHAARSLDIARLEQALGLVIAAARAGVWAGSGAAFGVASGCAGGGVGDRAAISAGATGGSCKVSGGASWATVSEAGGSAAYCCGHSDLWFAVTPVGAAASCVGVGSLGDAVAATSSRRRSGVG